jgi:hypothetical protein
MPWFVNDILTELFSSLFLLLGRRGLAFRNNGALWDADDCSHTLAEAVKRFRPFLHVSRGFAAGRIDAGLMVESDVG